MTTETQTTETEQPEKPKSKMPWKWIFIVAIVVWAVRHFGGSSTESGASNCNCQYEDGMGNKKRTHAIDLRTCTEMMNGEWLGYDADCKVPRY